MSSSFLSQLQSFYRGKVLEISVVFSAVGVFFLGMAIVGLVIFSRPTIHSESNKPDFEPQDAAADSLLTKACCTVHVSGAVRNPGVYQLDPAARVQEAILEAGGFNSQADTSYISQSINLAKKLEDQEKIYIPEKNGDLQEMMPENQTSSSSSSTTKKVSINKATQKELEDLPTIGEKTAEKIISLRPYSTLSSFFEKVKLSESQQMKLRELISL